MNQRIKQLAEQANPDFTKSYLVGPWHAEDIEKFALLIVKECIELNKQELAFNAFERMLNRYKEHFGVEE